MYDEQGSALSIRTTSGALAGLLFPAIGGYIGAQFGWHWAIAFGAATTCAILIATVQLLPSITPETPGQKLSNLGDLDRHL